MNQKIKKQILAIRARNMFDIKAVQKIAYEMDFYELVIFLDEYQGGYTNFILYGDKK